MKTKLLLCLALVLGGALSGCVMDRQFYGTGTNLKGKREQIPLGSHLKMSVAGSGDTTNGGRYMVLSLPHQDCWFVLFYPTVGPGQWLRMEIGAKKSYAWRSEGAGTSDWMKEVQNGSEQSAAWFVRGKQFDFSRLALGTSQFGLSVTNSEQLRGQVEIGIGMNGHSEFDVNVDLSGDDGTTTLQGEFWSYKSLWPPLLGPAMLVFGDDGPGGSMPRQPTQSQMALWPGNKEPLANIKISVHGDVNRPGEYQVSEGTTITAAIQIAGGFRNAADTNNVRVIRKENVAEETWSLNLSSPVDGTFMLIQGDEVLVQAK
jgi:hypothetical protein